MKTQWADKQLQEESLLGIQAYLNKQGKPQ